MPICSATRMISVPFGTRTSNPSTATVTRSPAGGMGRAGLSAAIVTRRPPERASQRSEERSEGAAGLASSCWHRLAAAGQLGPFGLGQQRHVVVLEVLDGADDRAGRAVAERAERPAED